MSEPRVLQGSDAMELLLDIRLDGIMTSPVSLRLGLLDDAVRATMAANPSWVHAKVLGRLSGYPDADRCWVFPATVGSYGKVRIPRSSGLNATAWVHRVVWLTMRGAIARGLVLDHDGPNGCSNRACANPAHMQVVTLAHNTAATGASWAARNASKTHCPAGHALMEGNLTQDSLRRGQRQCLACAERRERERTDALRDASRALGISQYQVMQRYGRSVSTYRELAANHG